MRTLSGTIGYLFGLIALLAFTSCHPVPGPDKTFTGAVLGAGWGAGAGAIIGHQVGHVGPGAGIGAGFGAVSGMMSGIGLDVSEGTELQQQRDLDALKVQIASNYRSLMSMQDVLDSRVRGMRTTGNMTQIFFDPDGAYLRSGSAARLQRLADTIKLNPYVGTIELHGHSDDMGSAKRNIRLSEARARSIATFLANQGVSLDQIQLFSHGATKPLASNRTQAGRQLNRRVEVVLLK